MEVLYYLAKIETVNQKIVFFYLLSDWSNFGKSNKIDMIIN